MSPDSLNIATLDGDAVDLDPTALEGIPEKARVLPSDPRFDEATLIWNGLISRPW